MVVEVVPAAIVILGTTVRTPPNVVDVQGANIPLGSTEPGAPYMTDVE